MTQKTKEEKYKKKERQTLAIILLCLIYFVSIMLFYNAGYFMGSFQMAINFSHNDNIENNTKNIDNIENNTRIEIDRQRGLREIECITKVKEWDSQSQTYHISEYYIESPKCYEVLK